MKLKYITGIVMVAVSFSLSLITISCKVPVELENPFDPDVKIPTPFQLKVEVLQLNTVKLTWQTNIETSSEEVKKNIITVIEKKETNLYGIRIPTIESIDSIKGYTTTAVFNTPLKDGYVYEFQIRILAGSNSSDYTYSTSIYGRNFILGL